MEKNKSAGVGKRILLVDDDLGIRESINMILGMAGYETKEVSSGVNAIEELKKVKYDLLITDVMMPGMDGFEVIEKCRELDTGIPIIMITANRTTNKSRIEEVLNKDVFACIDKPFDIWKFTEVVNRAVGINMD